MCVCVCVCARAHVWSAYLCVCVCVRARARACVRVCVCVLCVHYALADEMKQLQGRFSSWRGQRQHTSAYVSILERAARAGAAVQAPAAEQPTQHTSAYVSMRQHTSAYVSIRQHAVQAPDALCPVQKKKKLQQLRDIGSRGVCMSSVHAP